ncbi:MAG: type VI secretion system-associated FHA domain protein TagH [Plesiomonas sp.]
MNGINQQLSLVVLNSEQLDGHSLVQYRFDQYGGTLGAADHDDWCLTDRLGAVLPSHARIELHDGRFCLSDLSGQTFINGATAPIGRHRKVYLEQGDELCVGPFRLRVYLGAMRSKTNIEQTLENHVTDELDNWLAGDLESPIEGRDALRQSDPLQALEREQASSLAALLKHPVTEHSVLIPAISAPLFSAIEDTMDQEFIDMPSIDHPYAQSTEEDDVDHVALTPLMHGLGQRLQTKDSQQAHEMLEEIGKTLRAMVEGLLTLQVEQAALADKHLRPIEDNPLRLGLDYEATLALLFADGKSPVHLSAPAAVNEVLRNVRIHHIANQQAIAAALDNILQAFSPQALLGRFTHYRRTSLSMEHEEGWAWTMYQHYYRELTSVRQQGFDKLFHQVYDQAYDRAVREQQEQF